MARSKKAIARQYLICEWTNQSLKQLVRAAEDRFSFDSKVGSYSRQRPTHRYGTLMIN